MLYRSKPKKVFLYAAPVDFRKQINGLASIVDMEFTGEVFQGSWFVFVASDRMKVKILYWRDCAFALWQLRLEKDHINLGVPRFSGKRILSWRDLGRFLDGQNIFHGSRHEKISPKRFS